MGEGEITRQEVERMVTSAIAAYEASNRQRHESQMAHLREVYGNGSGHKGFLERAHEENTKELHAQTEVLRVVKEYVDSQKRKQEVDVLLEQAKETALVSRDKQLDRLVKYARMGAPLLGLLLGKDWIVSIWHSLAHYIH